MAKVQGTCDARFAEVEKLFQSFLDDGAELGASFFVNIDGKPAIDLWGGYADAARTRTWERDTITTAWSTTKTITALAALILIDRGVLDPDEKVSKYWPEFAANGKENVLVRHFMSHTSGVSGWDESLTLEEAVNLPRSTALLAAQAPWWEPGTASGYHSFNYGHLIGELVRRTTGKGLRQFVAEEIAAPLKTTDFQIGANEEDWGRVAETIPPPAFAGANAAMAKLYADPNGVPFKTMRTPGPPPPNAAAANTETWRRAEIGAGNGHGNARGVARMLSVIALGGEVDGVKLLSPATIERIFEEQSYGVDGQGHACGLAARRQDLLLGRLGRLARHRRRREADYDRLRDEQDGPLAVWESALNSDGHSFLQGTRGRGLILRRFTEWTGRRAHVVYRLRSLFHASLRHWLP